MRLVGFGIALACTACGGGGAHHGPDAAIPPPPTTCDPPVQPVDTSHPTTVVGTGSSASCTEGALANAIAAGGIITFDCGAAPATITVTAQLDVKQDTTIDGGGMVTLSGGGTSRILHIASAWNVATPTLTVQHLTFTGGFETDVPNTTSTQHGGGAIFEDGGSLTVIDCTFTGNQCAETGQDVSGGAINGQGVGTLIIVGSTFTNNHGSNGGAVGTQDEHVTVVDSVFDSNMATGSGGNPGNGGDGGGLTYDGAGIPLTMCGVKFTNNHAGAQGGAVFRVAYGMPGDVATIDRSTFDNNASNLTTGLAGGLYLENMVIDMTGTTISHNQAHYGGGFWIGQSAVANLTNVTIADNTADMGAGVWFANGITGRFLNCTIAGNGKDGLFGGGTGVALANTIVAGNTGYACTDMHGDGGADLQLPAMGTCTTSATVADPLLGALADNGGPTLTMLPMAGSPAIGAGAMCPAVDQRGQPRPTACTLGAVEP
jgi:hypothetical protein